ncbi:MAG: hypothetical protein IKZ62_08335 [Prevotella sp.]|nr:hypothetical protein [Prevotella sp.]
MNKTKRQEEATRFSFDYLRYFLQQEGVVERMVERKLNKLENQIEQLIDQKIEQRIKNLSNNK